MKRRKILQGTSAALAVGIAGCSDALSAECGPGEDTIEDAAAQAEQSVGEYQNSNGGSPPGDPVALEAEIVSFAETELVVDDGTGVAKLWPPLEANSRFDSQEFEEGNCTGGEGIPLAAPDDPDVDVILIVNPGG